MKIAIIAPSGPPDPHLLQKGIELLDEKFGPVEFEDAPNIGLREGYLAGEDDDRTAGVRWAFEESDATHVWFARGGYGATRILDRLPWEIFAATGKILLGYSDATAFLFAYHAAGGRAIHAPMIATDIARGGSERTWESLGRIVFGKGEDRFSFTDDFGGKISGRLVAANLAVLAALAGTRFFPRVENDTVLFLEEINEEPYRIDRSLTQLRAAGLFENVRAVVFGSMTNCVAEDPSKSFSVDQVIGRFAKEVGIPVLRNFPFGHGGVNTSLPLGGRVELSGDQRTVEVGVYASTY